MKKRKMKKRKTADHLKSNPNIFLSSNSFYSQNKEAAKKKSLQLKFWKEINPFRFQIHLFIHQALASGRDVTDTWINLMKGINQPGFEMILMQIAGQLHHKFLKYLF